MYIKKIINIFRHLKLEIALAIPASNDEKYNSSNSAGQGFNMTAYPSCHMTLSSYIMYTCNVAFLPGDRFLSSVVAVTLSDFVSDIKLDI